MLGEHDLLGFNLLSRRALLTVSLLVSILIVLMFIPGVVGQMFGVKDPQEIAALDHVLRIFSLMMLPFAFTLVLVAVYQVLELICHDSRYMAVCCLSAVADLVGIPRGRLPLCHGAVARVLYSQSPSRLSYLSPHPDSV